MIYRDPLLSSRCLFPKRNEVLDDHVEPRAFARQALCEGMRRLGIRANENVIVPAYICHEALECMRQYGIGVRFCDVDSQLKMDPKQALARSDSSEPSRRRRPGLLRQTGESRSPIGSWSGLSVVKGVAPQRLRGVGAGDRTQRKPVCAAANSASPLPRPPGR